jgi:integrase
MPRKTAFGMEHVKSVKRGQATYLYFNTGQKVDGKPVYVPLGKKGTIEVGTRYSAALAQRKRAAGDPSGLTIPQLSQRFQRSPDYCKRSAGTQRTYAVYLNRLSREFDTAPAAAFQASDILELMDEMADKPAAVDMLLLAGGQMFLWAKKRKLVAHNPFEEIDREGWDQREYEPWPDEVLEEALADKRLRLPVALLYFTAQRIGDCCGMEWADIHEGELFVTQQKTGKELHIRLHSQLVEILVEAPKRGATILADAKGNKAKHQTIRDWIKSFGADRGLDLVPHGLRKNAVNALLEAGCSVGEVSAISGQSLRMVEHYARKRNNRRMGSAAVAKWERLPNRETNRKTGPETAET